MRSFASGLVWVAALASIGCGSGTGATEPQTKTSMTLQSTSFVAGQAIPDKYSNYGSNISPQLSWSSPPSGTKSLVLLVEDPDAPSPQPFVHWLVYNIPPSDTSVSEGNPPNGGVLGQNSEGDSAYFGPKPPSGTHHYHFKLFAVDELVPVGAGSTKDDVMKTIAGHTLGQAELVGTYSH